MTTSIVIPVYNGLKFLRTNLSAVLALKADEVLVVDDASTDGSPQFIPAPVKLIRHLKNTGFPISVNDGFSNSTGDIVILLNQDVLPDKNLLKFALPHFADPKVFAVTFNESGRSWAKAEVVSGLLEFTNGPADNRVHQSFWASGGSAAFRKSYWDRLGGFDPIFTPGYYEDLDLGWRAQKAGFKIIWDPKARVEHAAPESTFNASYPVRKLQRIKDRNFLICNLKNLDQKDFFPFLKSTLFRCLSHPGYIIPFIVAVLKFPPKPFGSVRPSSA